jgi:NAD(P)-dependent dehydrogenase (short-subunit alcohol dehydrogenase family)
MVLLPAIKQTLGTKTPTRLTALFIGGTSGIGKYTVLALAQHCSHPTIYIVGRSEPSYRQILSRLRVINPNGTYHFIASDISLVKNVDIVCEEIREKVRYINLLVLSQGVFGMGEDTEEGIRSAASLILHSRTRFILNLLPLIQAAPAGQLRRVLSIFCGTKEGPLPPAAAMDIQMRTATSPLKARGQAATMLTLLLEETAARAPDVGFVHDFPGYVKGNSARGGGWGMSLLRTLYALMGPFVFIPEAEVGERHLWLGTSSSFAGKGEGEAMGSDGEVGSGVYVVDEKCDVCPEGVLEVLKVEREKGMREVVWGQVREDYMRITGKESL